MPETRFPRLREVRKTKGLTQTRLGGIIGSPQSTIARLELGQHEPTLRTALALARALDSTVETLFGEIETTERTESRRPRPEQALRAPEPG